MIHRLPRITRWCVVTRLPRVTRRFWVTRLDLMYRLPRITRLLRVWGWGIYRIAIGWWGSIICFVVSGRLRIVGC